ncbi:MAG: tRNA pseudouridine(13) synthase TruD [Candidatus Brocadia sp.]|jgi:tRNA pseudouridine13 synthase|uniref:tRNA pseudouridine synthase D n=1 Tax=Candidatus Brocadia fulgida TaxID=380242 RepID=A0A0M2UXH5_9BACT|nr:MAG: tRNA pseudouridine synthase D [Candidatus Brocadia fulgida]MCC6325290.1 tRNA pseudouridine(13) synthase TruD [Candidatus Brocadia sp.]MCE7912545.1 tRNA pseudouridine(13) synthase TruD [Candidatus Brocadia sp. AMX3]OQY98721.1 MAG: hypothetical protein B6D35_11225 [Candidatus Brocadia sp. UTAMX2]MBV6519717.1 tRNA pseudouridine synthase D [Candidatus Brocadia fulgida]
MIKVKARPEDFIVEEVADLPFQRDGNFCVYLLKKRGWNTVDILKMLSRKLNIPYASFSYGGKKDKYALTSQYITIARQIPSTSQGKDFVVGVQPNDKGGMKRPWIKSPNSTLTHAYSVPSKIDEENYSTSLVGCMDRPMGPDLITGNRFQIAVRNLTDDDLASALGEIDLVKQDGYPNYFDDQRFGSFDARQGFIAEKILKKHYSGALKIYFSGIHPEDSKEEKEHRKFFYENWGNWRVCLTRATSKFERETFRYLEKHPKGFIPILQRISHEKMVLFFSAYQSHLWNEVLRKILRHSEQGEESCLKISRGIAGDYILYTQLDDRNKAYLSGLIIPMPASNIRMPDAFTKNLYAEVLKENNLKSSLFNIRKIRQAFFKGIERRAIVTPEDLSVDSAEDEIYQGRKKLALKFFLPRGCYGTMFIKRLFC